MSRAQIERLSRAEINDLISSRVLPKLSPQESASFKQYLKQTQIIWAGVARGQVYCICGIMPPTLVSSEAYLWIHFLEDPTEFEFVFVRQSQRAVQEIQKEFPVIFGHCSVDNPRAIRWIKWLGGVFGEPKGQLVPFRIAPREVVNG